MSPLQNSITDVPGIAVGHADDPEALTGCTVILCERGAVGGVDQRGGAPGTREVDALHPMHLVQKAHAVVLAGGSAFGLDAATGAVKWLEERGVGFNVGVAKVPIVPAAILFDLGIGNPNGTTGLRDPGAIIARSRNRRTRPCVQVEVSCRPFCFGPFESSSSTTVSFAFSTPGRAGGTRPG